MILIDIYWINLFLTTNKKDGIFKSKTSVYFAGSNNLYNTDKLNYPSAVLLFNDDVRIKVELDVKDECNDKERPGRFERHDNNG